MRKGIYLGVWTSFHWQKKLLMARNFIWFFTENNPAWGTGKKNIPDVHWLRCIMDNGSSTTLLSIKVPHNGNYEGSNAGNTVPFTHIDHEHNKPEHMQRIMCNNRHRANHHEVVQWLKSNLDCKGQNQSKHWYTCQGTCVSNALTSQTLSNLTCSTVSTFTGQNESTVFDW